MTNNQEQLSFYRKMAELQEKLRRSEEERSELESKFQALAKNGKAAEAARLANLRQKYTRFLEEEKRRKARNERILNALDKIEKQTATLTAKTERLRLLRRHFDAYMARTYPDWRDKISQGPTQPAEFPLLVPPSTVTSDPGYVSETLAKEHARFQSLMQQRFTPNRRDEIEILKREFGDLATPLGDLDDANTSRDLLSSEILNDKENEVPKRWVPELVVNAEPAARTPEPECDKEVEDEEILISKLAKISSFDNEVSPDENHDQVPRPGTSMADREADQEAESPEPLHVHKTQKLAYHRNDLFKPKPFTLDHIREVHGEITAPEPMSPKSIAAPVTELSLDAMPKHTNSEAGKKDLEMSQEEFLKAVQPDFVPRQNFEDIEEKTDGSPIRPYYVDHVEEVQQQLEDQPEKFVEETYEPEESVNEISYAKSESQGVFSDYDPNYPPGQYETAGNGSYQYYEGQQERSRHSDRPDTIEEEISGQFETLEGFPAHYQGDYYEDIPPQQNQYGEQQQEYAGDYRQEIYPAEGQYQNDNLYKEGQNDSNNQYSEEQYYQQQRDQQYENYQVEPGQYPEEISNQYPGEVPQGQYPDQYPSEGHGQYVEGNYSGMENQEERKEEKVQGMYAGAESSESTSLQRDLELEQQQHDDVLGGFKEMELVDKQPVEELKLVHPEVVPEHDADTLAELDSSELTGTVSEPTPVLEAGVTEGEMELTSSEDTVERQVAALIQQPQAPAPAPTATASPKSQASPQAKSPGSSAGSSRAGSAKSTRGDSRPSSSSTSGRSKPPSPGSKRPTLASVKRK